VLAGVILPHAEVKSAIGREVVLSVLSPMSYAARTVVRRAVLARPDTMTLSLTNRGGIATVWGIFQSRVRAPISYQL
jgi:hypothetical protein